jgi:hypothetical protein
MQISGKSVENLLVNMVLKTFNKKQFWKGTLPFLFTWE